MNKSTYPTPVIALSALGAATLLFAAAILSGVDESGSDTQALVQDAAIAESPTLFAPHGAAKLQGGLAPGQVDERAADQAFAMHEYDEAVSTVSHTNTDGDDHAHDNDEDPRVTAILNGENHDDTIYDPNQPAVVAENVHAMFDDEWRDQIAPVAPSMLVEREALAEREALGYGDVVEPTDANAHVAPGSDYADQIDTVAIADQARITGWVSDKPATVELAEVSADSHPPTE